MKKFEDCVAIHVGKMAHYLCPLPEGTFLQTRPLSKNLSDVAMSGQN